METMPLFEFVVGLVLLAEADLVEVVCETCDKVRQQVTSPSAFTSQHKVR